MKKQNTFANMFAAAINWDVVDANIDAIAAALDDKKEGKNDD